MQTGNHAYEIIINFPLFEPRKNSFSSRVLCSGHSLFSQRTEVTLSPQAPNAWDMEEDSGGVAGWGGPVPPENKVRLCGKAHERGGPGAGVFQNCSSASGREKAGAS